jgi:hypothetical protein
MSPQDTGRSVSDRVDVLCRTSVRDTAMDGGSVALVTRSGSRVVLASTDELALGLESEQMTLGEGPYVDAQDSLAPVLVPDLDPASAGGQRWPFFAGRAAALGVCALFAFPIQVSTLSIGTLGLYRRRPGALGVPQLGSAMSAVDEIASVLLDLDAWNDEPDAPAEADPDRRVAVALTAQMHQAAGMVMIQLDVGILEAMALLRATAFVEGLPLLNLARDVVERRRRLGRGDPR